MGAGVLFCFVLGLCVGVGVSCVFFSDVAFSSVYFRVLSICSGKPMSASSVSLH